VHSAERQEEQNKCPQHGQFSFEVKKLKRLPQAVHASPEEAHCERGTGYPGMMEDIVLQAGWKHGERGKKSKMTYEKSAKNGGPLRQQTHKVRACVCVPDKSTCKEG
jgi:hypothetical protein